MKEYEKSLDEIYALAPKKFVLNLKNIAHLLDSLGNPQSSFKSIHVAGTNGKGSTVEMISSILIESGYSVGTYTSPHITDFRERIRINGKRIDKVDFVRIFSKIKKQNIPVTMFEATTALAFMHFAEKSVDYAVVETGLGGRLDATNTIMPCASVITNVDYDHTDILGRSIRKIAWEKAGIIKKGIPLVTAEKKRSVLDVFRKICRQKNSPLLIVGRDVKIQESESPDEFFIFGREKYRIHLNLLGEHQRMNAATAVCAVEASGAKITKESVEKGLAKTKLHGRLEIVRKKPMLVFDGAHNTPAAKAVRKALTDFEYKKLILVVGMMRDKDMGGFLAQLAPLAHLVVVNRPSVDRAAEPKEIARLASAFCKRIKIVENVRNSIKYALSEARPDDMVLVTGSIYMLCEAKGHKPRVAQ
ncbi:MAG: folylpolyglutamate synthase/dihydrofolate synthase family protein [Candidatus Micrarchaeia archaeon]